MTHTLRDTALPKNDRSRSASKWTRTGCTTCKKRRKKCDESRPGCQNCARLGKICEGYETMWMQPLSSSMTEAQVCQRLNTPSRPAARADSSRPQRISPLDSKTLAKADGTPEPSFTIPPDRTTGLFVSEDGDNSDWLGFNLLDFKIDEPQPDAHRMDGVPTRTAPFVGISHSWSVYRHVSEMQKYFIQYYVERASNLLINLEIDDNPLRTLFLQRAYASPLLLDALCAVAACHQSNQSPESGSSTSKMARYYYGRALREVNVSLQSNGNARMLPADDVTLAVALLCKFEVVNGSTEQWIQHLDGLGTLIALKGGFLAFEPDIGDFLRSLYGYHYGLSRITSLRSGDYSLCSLEDKIMDSVDIYSGFTRDILILCACIANLCRYIPLTSGRVEALCVEVKAINTELKNWNVSSRSYIVPRGVSVASLGRSEAVANSFRHAAFVYLHSVLDHITSSQDSDVNLSELQMLHTQISYTKAEAVDNTLATIERNFPLDRCEFSALCFPLFVAGCETSRQEHYATILSAVNQLELNFGIGNTSRVKSVLDHIWGSKMTDGGGKHWYKVLRELGWEILLS